MAAGRPAYQITPELLVRVELLAAQGMNNLQIAKSLGWNYDTLRVKKKQYSVFSAAIEAGQAKGIATITNALFINAKEGNFQAQSFYLKNKAGWTDKTETTHNINEVKSFSDMYPSGKSKS